MEAVGREMHALISRLYPICRSITGNGQRETLQIIQSRIPLAIHEVSSGTQVFDWTIPKEWNIKDAYVKDSAGKRIIDFKKSNLHVVNYSTPIRTTVSWSDLKPHLHTLPDHPEWIPYRTSYYKETWGFCLSQNQMLQMSEGEYEVCIDSSIEDGHLSYGEYYLPGKTSEEILLSCHVCHPSLCNDNLSGIALMTMLAGYLASLELRFSYRFIFIPGTIGAITWLCMNEDQVEKIRHGLVVACVGDNGNYTYKRSRRGNAEIDRAVAHVLRHSGRNYEIQDFSPYGYDERQFCSAGFNLPVGSLTRTPHGRFPQYHTSADDLELVRPEYLTDSLRQYLSVLEVLEGNSRFLNLNPKCEPQLGKRGLYRMIGGHAEGRIKELAMLWVLNLSDTEHTLLDIAERSGLAFKLVHEAAHALLEHGLLEELRC